MLEGPIQGVEKAIESRRWKRLLPAIRRRGRRAISAGQREWVSHVTLPTNLLYHADEPRYSSSGSRPVIYRAGITPVGGPGEKPAGLEASR